MNWDGRKPAAGLRLLVEQLWPADSDVVVTLGAPPAGHQVLEQYAVMPSVEAARMLMPMDRRVATASLLAYNKLRRPRVRARKVASAAAFGSGLGKWMTRGVLSVCLPPSAADSDQRLLGHLSTVLGPGVAAIGVAAPAPNRKPTLQLFDPAGQAKAFVKVGWNDYTRGLVDHEASVLADLSSSSVPMLPRVLHSGSWHGRSLLATAPMPPGVTRHLPGAGPRPDLISRIATGRRSERFGESAYLKKIKDDCRRVGALLPDGLAERYRQRVLRDHEDLAMDFGAWHGDWSPWNMGTVGRQVWVWDWEHYADLAPVGLDLVHYTFQRRFVQGGATVGAALDTARQVVPSQLPEVGVDPALAPALVDLYCLEMLLRACRMKQQGAGQNERFMAGALAHAGSRAA
ncbi:hypothetical protein [Kineosporia babensis]|uniref:Aminoglycoside phosphotransferase domain-containing protein n=1 Tax=Kineosporia babensis TaxID=499548 RepID=A0A9X1SX24_9ACTN|nr:hypothetical protein [Kineosporia babensis]MCD5315354.1 hypothetical protein [Kineosporia babensis]